MSENESPSVAPESQPFNLKNLERRLIEKGLPAIEGLAKAAVEAVFDWAEEGVKASDTKLDDFALAVLPPVKNWLMQKLEGISEK